MEKGTITQQGNQEWRGRRRRGDQKEHRFEKFPCDLIPDLLNRLPLHSLCRFKTVSKSWCSLIIHNFHLSPRRPIVGRLWDSTYTPWSSKPTPTLSFCAIDGKTGIAQPRWSWTNSVEYYQCSYVPINGLFVFIVNDELDSATLAICNPATAEGPLILPANPDYFDEKYCSCFDLGFDPLSKTYKLLGWSQFPSCTILTLGTSSWRPFTCTPPLGCVRPTLWSICIDGTMYWRDEDVRYTNMIISFHVADESFGSIKGPQGAGCPCPDDVQLGLCELEGCLCLYHVDKDLHTYNFWMLKDHTHWVMMAVITLPSVEIDLGFPFSTRKGEINLGFPYSTRKGEIVIGMSGKSTERVQYLYSFLTQRLKKLEVVGIDLDFHIYIVDYVENFTMLKDL